MIVFDHARWKRDDESWVKARPLLKEVLGYTDEDINNFIAVQEKFYFPPFAIDITKEQAALIYQPFLDNDLNTYCMIYDDITFKPVDFCYSRDLGVIQQPPKPHYYDTPVISEKQRVDPFNPPTFDDSWISLSLTSSSAYKPTTPTITCPYCKSTNTKKISGLSKAVSVGLFGIFALGKTTKQFHCNNCKADF